MSKEPKFFQVEKDEGVVIWRFYNPPNNLWNVDTRMDFMELVEDFYKDPELRVAIFTSAMPDVFIQHYDVSLLVKRGEELKQQKTPPAQPAVRRIGFRRDSKPIIAAINASLAGGGLEAECGRVGAVATAVAGAYAPEVQCVAGQGRFRRVARAGGCGVVDDVAKAGVGGDF